MTQMCAALSDEFDEVVLWTLRDAPRARRFYEKIGFRATGDIRPEALTDWTTGIGVERPTVQYCKPLRPRPDP